MNNLNVQNSSYSSISFFSLKRRICERGMCFIGLAMMYLCFANAIYAQAKVPEGFVVETVAADLDQPTAFDFLPDGRILVAERAGIVKMVAEGQIFARHVLDLRKRVNTGGLDRGLLDVSVDPNFLANRFIYVLYVYDAPNQKADADEARKGRLVRYRMQGDIADLDSEWILLDDFSSDTRNHAVGSIRFAPNGAMFVSLGDGAISEVKTDLSYRAQDLNSLNGKIIRIDPQTGEGIPPKWQRSSDVGNPYFDSANPKSTRSRIWSLGYRNPFRMGVDPNTGIPFVGDVGWNTIESIARATAASNFGWPCIEGGQARPEYMANPVCQNLPKGAISTPDYAYNHNGENASVTGGAFNTATHFPIGMQGDYFFADYSKQYIKRMRFDKDQVLKVVESFLEGGGEIVDLKFSEDGRLYYLSIFSGGLKLIRNSTATNIEKLNLEVKCTRMPCVTPTNIIQIQSPQIITFSTLISNSALDSTVFWFNPGDDTGTKVVSGTSQLIATHFYAKNGNFVARIGKDSTSLMSRLVNVGDAKPNLRVNPNVEQNEILLDTPLTFRANVEDVYGKPQSATVYWWVYGMVKGQRQVIYEARGDSANFSVSNAVAGQLTSDEIEVVCAALATNYHVATQRVQLHLHNSDGYIRTWWVSRGFPNRDIADDMLGGESKFVLKSDDRRFQLVHSNSRNIDLKAYITPNEQTFTQEKHVAYAYTWLYAPDERNALLGLNSDESIVVWLNNELVWQKSIARVFLDDTRDIDLPPIRLRKGLNQILIKIYQSKASNATWAFKARVLNSDGILMNDVSPMVFSGNKE
jgi:glucose/arabinose dehydrogenase